MNYLEIFNKLDVRGQGYLSTEQIKEFCERCFFCTLDPQRVEEAIVRVCGHQHCTLEHLRDVIGETIKLIEVEKNIRWEFKFLDKEGSGRISLSDALFLFKSVQGSGFTLASWQLFLSQRPNNTCNYVTCDELVEALLASGSSGGSTKMATTSFEDYMSNKLELSRMALEHKQTIYSELQKLVEDISSSSDNNNFLGDVLDENEVTTASTTMASSRVSLVDKAMARLEDIKKYGLDAFSFSPPKDSMSEDDKISSSDATTGANCTFKEPHDDNEIDIGPEQSDLDKRDVLKSIINKLILTIYKCLAEKLLADLVVCNHADVPRPESLQNDYSQLLSQLPSDMREVEEFSVDNKWTNALEKLFTRCDVHIYCLAVVETDCKLLEIFDNKIACTEKFAKLMNWLGRGCSQELITVERFLAHNCDLAAVHKMVLQFCYMNNALQQEGDFTSALLMSRVLQLSFKEQIFICQRKESATLSLLHLLLALARISRSSGNVSVVSLCTVQDAVLPEEMTVYLQNMALEMITRRDHLKSMDFIRVLKSRTLNGLLRSYNQNSLSIDSALLKYKKLKELNSESRKKSTGCYNSDITGKDDILMKGLAIRCHLLLTHSKRNTGISCLVDAKTKMLANLQKLQVHKTFALLDKICQEDLDNYSEVAETTQQNFDLLVFPTEDFLITQFYDTSVYTEVLMGIKALYMCLLRCLLWHTFETVAGSLKINLLSPLSKHMLIHFVMEKFSCAKTSNFFGLDTVLPGPVKGNLIIRYFDLLKQFCSERVVSLEGSQVLTHTKYKQFTTMQELINDFYAAQKEKPTLLQPSEAYHAIYQCMELEISLFRSAEKCKGHVTTSSEYGAALVVALFHTQYQEISNEADPNNSLCLMAQGLHLRHFDGSDYKCEAPLLQCFLAYNLLTKPMDMTRNCAGMDDEFEPLLFSSYARVSKCKSLLDKTKEQSYDSINLLRSILLHMKCDQTYTDGDVVIQLNQLFFLVTELYYQKNLTSQIKELIGDQIYYQCLLAKQGYSISPSDEKWILLVWLIMLLDQKQWNLFAYVATKAIKEVDNITKALAKPYCQTDSLLVMLCQIPASKCVVFQYLDIIKSYTVSALHSKYNVILSKLPPLCVQAGNQEGLLVWTEWLGKFWFMLKCGEHGKTVDASDHSKVVPLTYPWHQHFNSMEGKKKESNELSCTVAEVTSALGEMFSLELEEVLEQAKITDQNKLAFFRYKIARISWEQTNLKSMPTFETSLILLNVLKSQASCDNTNGYKDQLLKLAQLKSHGRNLTAEDVTMATSRMSSLMMHVERSVRAAKKSKMSIDNFATFGDFFLQIPEAIINEMMKKHKFEEEVFFSLCGTICEAEVAELQCEDDAVEKLRTDRQQWRLSAEVLGAQEFTSTITGVLILDEHHIKKREAQIKLLQKAMLINLRDAWKLCTEQEHPKFLENKIVDMFAYLIQVQLDEANGTIGKLPRMSVKSQRALYNEYRMSLVQSWLDNIAAVLLDTDPVQNRLMSNTMRLNLQQGHQLNEKLQRKKDSRVKARRSAMQLKRKASLSPYASEDEHGSTSSFLSALEEDSTPQELNQSMPELSFQAQLKRMAEIEKEFQSEKMKILSQLEEQQNKMEVKSPTKSRQLSLLTAGNVTKGSHQHLRDRAKSAGALKMKERMKERKRKKSSRLEPQLDYNSSADDTQEETPHQTSADDTITKISQLEKLYEEKQKMLLSSMQ